MVRTMKPVDHSLEEVYLQLIGKDGKIERGAAVNKVWLIFRKEWMEIRQQYLLLGGLVVVPLAFVIIIGVVMANPLSGNVHGLPSLDLSSNPELARLSDAQMVQLVFGMQLRMVFMLIPLLISSIIPAYSIVGEKNSRTLEPLLATPISSMQLLLGKMPELPGDCDGVILAGRDLFYHRNAGIYSFPGDRPDPHPGLVNRLIPGRTGHGHGADRHIGVRFIAGERPTCRPAVFQPDRAGHGRRCFPGSGHGGCHPLAGAAGRGRFWAFRSRFFVPGDPAFPARGHSHSLELRKI